jgi:hypothetical protein
LALAADILPFAVGLTTFPSGVFLSGDRVVEVVYILICVEVFAADVADGHVHTVQFFDAHWASPPESAYKELVRLLLNSRIRNPPPSVIQISRLYQSYQIFAGDPAGQFATNGSVIRGCYDGNGRFVFTVLDPNLATILIIADIFCPFVSSFKFFEDSEHRVLSESIAFEAERTDFSASLRRQGQFVTAAEEVFGVDSVNGFEFFVG